MGEKRRKKEREGESGRRENNKPADVRSPLVCWEGKFGPVDQGETKRKELLNR